MLSLPGGCIGFRGSGSIPIWLENGYKRLTQKTKKNNILGRDSIHTDWVAYGILFFKGQKMWRVRVIASQKNEKIKILYFAYKMLNCDELVVGELTKIEHKVFIPHKGQSEVAFTHLYKPIKYEGGLLRISFPRMKFVVFKVEGYYKMNLLLFNEEGPTTEQTEFFAKLVQIIARLEYTSRVKFSNGISYTKTNIPTISISIEKKPEIERLKHGLLKKGEIEFPKIVYNGHQHEALLSKKLVSYELDDVPPAPSAECVICYVNKKEIVLVPCGHKYACKSYVSNSNHCAICRVQITHKQMVYES